MTADPWPVPYVGVPFDLRTAALVLVDVQRYWTDPDGPLGKMLRDTRPDLHSAFYDQLHSAVVPNLCALLDTFRGQSRPVVHVVSGSAVDNGADMAPHLQRRMTSAPDVAGGFNQLRVGTEWHNVEPKLAADRRELVLNKTTRSAFVSTGLDQLLRHLRAQQIAVAGLVTNGCVGLTAMHGADLGYEAFLVSDASASFLDDAHDAALVAFGRVFGTVLSTAEVCGGRW